MLARCPGVSEGATGQRQGMCRVGDELCPASPQSFSLCPGLAGLRGEDAWGALGVPPGTWGPGQE